PPKADPELEALRDRYYRTKTAAGDTLPPRTTAKGTEAARERYAAELAELERMKAKFRRQQNDKLQQRDRGEYRWSETTPAPAATSTEVPSIGDVYTPPIYESPAAARQRAYADSLRMNASVRSNLYGNQAPKVYEREAWENDLRRDLPRNAPLSQEEAARLDADYQRKLDELAALKAELNRVNGTAPPPQPQQPAYERPAATGNPNWTTKGDPYQRTTAPTTYEQPASNPPRTYGQPASSPRTYEQPAYPPTPRSTYPPAATNQPNPGIPVGITFIYNTAYPDGIGYDGLDQLVRTVQRASGVVEVRVHTSVQLDRRAAQLLSEERALTIRNYLLEKGVNAQHFRVLGFGNNLTGQGGERVEVLE
ncbi:MAG: OmpA family protein, partial [Bacteroidota bacterium]